MPNPPHARTREAEEGGREREAEAEDEREGEEERMARAPEMGPMAFATSLAP